MACIYNLGNELLQTTAVQEWQHVNVVGHHTAFSGLISMFAWDSLQIPSGCNGRALHTKMLQFLSELLGLYNNVYYYNYLKCIYAQSAGKHKTRCSKVIDTITTLRRTCFAGCRAMCISTDHLCISIRCPIARVT